MAVKFKIGKSSGSGSNPSLEISVFDDAGAAIDRTTAMNAAINNAPITLYGIPINTVASIEEHADHSYKFSISYSDIPLSGVQRPTPPEAGSLVRRANFQASSRTLSHFLSAGKVYNNTGDITASSPKLKWAINAHISPQAFFEPQETSFDPLPESRTLDYYAPNATINDTYLDAVEAVMGHFNSATFKGRPAGTIQLVRFSCNERTPDDWEVSVGLGYKPQKTSFSVSSDITVASQFAYEYLWLRDLVEFDSSQNEIYRSPGYAIVGPVWEQSNLASVLNLP